MDEISILEKIIEEKGSCCWATPSICARCPLNRITQYESGRWVSCVESVGIDGLSEEEADAKYKDAAIKKLADLTVEKIIESE